MTAMTSKTAKTAKTATPAKTAKRTLRQREARVRAAAAGCGYWVLKTLSPGLNDRMYARYRLVGRAMTGRKAGLKYGFGIVWDERTSTLDDMETHFELK